MKIVFRQKAAADLRSIRAYYIAIDVAALSNVLDDIDRALNLLRSHPDSGRRIAARRLRKITTRRYGYSIAYEHAPNEIRVVGIFRHQNRVA